MKTLSQRAKDAGFESGGAIVEMTGMSYMALRGYSLNPKRQKLLDIIILGCIAQRELETENENS